MYNHIYTNREDNQPGKHSEAFAWGVRHHNGGHASWYNHTILSTYIWWCTESEVLGQSAWLVNDECNSADFLLLHNLFLYSQATIEKARKKLLSLTSVSLRWILRKQYVQQTEDLSEKTILVKHKLLSKLRLTQRTSGKIGEIESNESLLKPGMIMKDHEKRHLRSWRLQTANWGHFRCKDTWSSLTLGSMNSDSATRSSLSLALLPPSAWCKATLTMWQGSLLSTVFWQKTRTHEEWDIRESADWPQ